MGKAAGGPALQAGFIGLGDQGGPMAEMMLRASCPVMVWARRAETLAAYLALGATTAADPAALGAACDVVGLCVTGDADVRELVYARGLLAAMRPGAVLMIHSTIFPDTCREIARDAAERGVIVLDAPVSGSAARARAGTLLVIVGGDPAALERVRPLVETYADPILEVGDVGAAMTAKLINNLMAAVNYATAYDALALAAEVGLSPDHLREVALTGSGRNYGFELMPRAHRHDRALHISRILGKDVELALAALPQVRDAQLGQLARRAIVTIAGFAEGKGLVVTPSPPDPER